MHKLSPGQPPVHSLHGLDAVLSRTWTLFQRFCTCFVPEYLVRTWVLSALLDIEDTCCHIMFAVHDLLAAHIAHVPQSITAA